MHKARSELSKIKMPFCNKMSFETQSTIEVSTPIQGNAESLENDSIDRILNSSRNELDDSSGINLTDYSNATWTDVVSYGVPTVGVAFLALTHPVMFLAGAAISILGLGSAYAADVDTSNYSFCALASKGKDAPVPHELTIATDTSACSYDEENSHDTISQTIETKEVPKVDDFPPFEHLIVDKAHFSSLNAEDFFQIFFGDKAPFSFKDFQQKQGDVNVSYSPWDEKNNRIVHFQTPTRAAFFGASHATAVKSQEKKVFSKSCVIIDSTTHLKDIPFSDRFVVVERWVFCSDHQKNLFVSISAQVKFHTFCPFESQIKNKTISTLMQTLPQWRVLAEKALIATHRRVKAKDCAPDGGIEVGITDDNNKTYVFGEGDWEMDPLTIETNSPQSNSFKKVRKSMLQNFAIRKK